MGRPNKYNLQYFPLEVNFWEDHKIISIEEEARIENNDPKAGIIAGYIALRIMAMVYADHGYYLDWPDKFEMTAAKRIGNGITGAEVKKVFDLCLKHNLFDQEIYEKHQVVTSAGIQARWKRVQSDMRRKVVVNVLYGLISSEETPPEPLNEVITSEETTLSQTLSTQKENKGNETKNNKEAPEVAAPAMEISTLIKPEEDGKQTPPKRKKITRPEKFVAPSEQQTIEYFTKKQYNPKNPGSWYPDRCQREAIDFVNFYTANGWVQGKQEKPIRSWTAAANIWISRAKNGEFGGPAINGHPATQPPKEQTIAQIRTKEMPILSRDINYLYERFRENPAGITTLSLSVPDYDHLKANGKVNFDDQKRATIRLKALQELEAVTKEPTETMVIQMMKKIGVLEVFKQYHSENKETIFAI